jgi:hypothetical protein
LWLPAKPENHFDRFDLLLLPAFFKAIATACFCGLPAFISVLMFELIVLREEPFLRGIETSSYQNRPIKTRINTTIRMTPRTPAGPGPQAALYGQLGSAPIKSSTKMMSKMVPNDMFVASEMLLRANSLSRCGYGSFP